jgi:hypothetical protein
MRRRLIILFVLTCVVGAGITSITISRRAAKADSISTMVSGNAYGLNVIAASGATLLSSGPIGEVSTDCDPDPVNQQNTTLNLNLFQGWLTSTGLQDRLTFTHSDYLSTAVSTSTIEKLTIGKTLLGPLVEVDGLHSEAHSTARIGVATSTTSFSYFGAIKIAGMHLPLNIPVNDRIVLPALGTIVLNEQIVQNLSPTNTSAEVNMVDITLGVGNILGQSVGTHIIIGHAVSLDGDVTVLAALHSHASGFYTALAVKNITTIQVGPVPDTEIGCLGGDNTASAISLSTPILIDGGIAETQVTGSITQNLVTTSSSEKIADLNLFGGLVRAQFLQANAYASYNGSKGSALGDLTVLGLTVGGVHILPDVHASSDRINLPGFGYILIGERVPSPLTFGYAMNALDIYITTPNILNLAVGLQIVVGHVDAGISVF